MNCKKYLVATVLSLSLFGFMGYASFADEPMDSPEDVTVETVDSTTLDKNDIEHLLNLNTEQTQAEIEQEEKEAEAQKAKEEEKNNSKADKLISIAKSKLGSPYVYGATGPNAFDCSGFTSYVYRQMGISLPRVASSQAYGGKRVSKANLKKGDLVFFNTYGGISHVGIYIANGQFVHASSYRTGVIISNINDSYYSSRYVTAARYL